MFWENFYTLCERKDVKPLQVVKELGIAAGSITAWKNGTLPSQKNLQKLANYFDVSVEYFFVEHPSAHLIMDVSHSMTPAASEDDELTAYLEELKNRPEMRMLFSLAKGATKEDVEKAVAIIEALRKSNNG